MNTDEHVIIGLFIGLFWGVMSSNFSEFFNFIFYIIYVGLVIFGSILPNIIEPPKDRNSRKFFHSWVVFGVTTIVYIWLIFKEQSVFTYLTNGFLLGYLSHLLLDATSRVGLPKY
jgi:inner membrane protein